MSEYDALYRFAQETATKADRLPDWKKPESPWHDDVSQQIGAARRLLTPVPLDDSEQDDDPDYGF